MLFGQIHRLTSNFRGSLFVWSSVSLSLRSWNHLPGSKDLRLEFKSQTWISTSAGFPLLNVVTHAVILYTTPMSIFRSCSGPVISFQTDRWKISVFISGSPHTWDTVYYYGIHCLELFNILFKAALCSSFSAVTINLRNSIFTEDVLKSRYFIKAVESTFHMHFDLICNICY